MDLASARNVIAKAGTYFNYGDVRLGQGRDNARAYLEQNPELFEEIDRKVRAMFLEEKVPAPVASAAVESDEE